MVQRAMAIESRKENVQTRWSCTAQCGQQRITVSRKLLFDQVLDLYHSEIYQFNLCPARISNVIRSVISMAGKRNVNLYFPQKKILCHIMTIISYA